MYIVYITVEYGILIIHPALLGGLLHDCWVAHDPVSLWFATGSLSGDSGNKKPS